MPAGRGTVEFGKPRRPEDAGDAQEIRRQLPPLGVIASIEMLKRFPVFFFRIHRIDHLAKRTRQPYGVCGAGGGNKRRIRVNRPDGVRQAVAPGENETRQLDQPAGAGNRRRQIHDFRIFDLEKAAVVIRFAQGADQRQNGGPAAQKIDEFGAQHTGGAARRHVNRHLGKRQRIGRVVFIAGCQCPVTQRFRERLEERCSRSDRQNALCVVGERHAERFSLNWRMMLSASSIASGVPTVIQWPSRESPKSRSLSMARSK